MLVHTYAHACVRTYRTLAYGGRRFGPHPLTQEDSGKGSRGCWAVRIPEHSRTFRKNPLGLFPNPRHDVNTHVIRIHNMTRIPEFSFLRNFSEPENPRTNQMLRGPIDYIILLWIAYYARNDVLIINVTIKKFRKRISLVDPNNTCTLQFPV